MNSINLLKRMHNIFTNSKNSETSEPHTLLLNHSDKIDFKKSDKYVVLSNLGMCYAWKNIKRQYKNNESKISGSTCSKEFELLDGSYSVSDIQDYFEYIIKKMKN